MAEPVLGVVPVLGGAALQSPAGRPLLLQALDLLVASELIGPVLVTVDPGRLDAVRGLPPGADLLPAEGGLVAALRAALAARPGNGPVLLLDPVQVHTPPQLVPAVLEALQGTVTAAGSGPYLEPVDVPGDGPPDAVVPVRPVTDTLKRIDSAGTLGRTVSGTEDRDGYRWALTPQAFRRSALTAALDATGEDGDGPALLPRLLARNGALVATLAAAVDVLRAEDADGLELAAAVYGGGWRAEGLSRAADRSSAGRT